VLVLLFAFTSRATTIHRLERSCLDSSKRATSPSNPVVKIRWEGWESAALTITIAAMILQERMGFKVEFVSADGTFSYES